MSRPYGCRPGEKFLTRAAGLSCPTGLLTETPRLVTLLAILLILAGPFAGMLAGWLAANWQAERLRGLHPPACETCKASPGWTGCVPFLDLVASLGRCRACGKPISRRQPVCEFGGLLVAVTAVAFAPPDTLVLSCVFGWSLLTLAAIDWRTFILPDPLNLLVAMLGAVMVWLTRPDAWLDHLIGGLAGFLLLFALELFYRYGRDRHGLGRGDAKLLGAIGIWTGWQVLPDILLVSSFSALVAALLASRLKREKLSGTTALPFGPWLALAGWTVWLTGPLLLLFA